MKEKIIPQIEVKKGSITIIQVEAVVCPSNSFGYMGEEIAEVMKKVGGQIIEDEAIDQAPIQLGEAVLTNAGDLICKKVIHAPITHNPAEKTDSNKIGWAVSAALELADKLGFKNIAIPGIGIDEINKKEIAKTIVDTIKSTEFESIEKIILIDNDEEMIKEFKKEATKKRT
jgi:O-acetyl-ADP-ribose deacetylase (regulator of RNase III)